MTDKGKGIDKAFADRVFDRLFTMKDSRRRSVHGNGLGLTIAKKLALQIGGEISLESVPYVKTMFTVKRKRVSYEIPAKEICKIYVRVLNIRSVTLEQSLRYSLMKC